MKKKELFDFDTVLERRGTASLKWEKYKERDIILMWLADMDFQSPPAVIRGLQQRIENGVFGYTTTPDELNETVKAMLQAKYRLRCSIRMWPPARLPSCPPVKPLTCRD
jgi:cystathionine beta-lyase